jgi:hypothetical protein
MDARSVEVGVAISMARKMMAPEKGFEARMTAPMERKKHSVNIRGNQQRLDWECCPMK